MKVIIDGGEPIEVGNDVKIVHDEQLLEYWGEEVEGELHLTMTHEGMISDFIENGAGDHVTATSAMDLETIIGNLV
jgi:hypothetical protein